MLADDEACAQDWDGVFFVWKWIKSNIENMSEVNLNTVFKKMAVGLLFQVPVATYQTEAPAAPGMELMIGLHPL